MPVPIQDAIREAYTRAGLNQTELGLIIGSGQGSVSAWSSGSRGRSLQKGLAFLAAVEDATGLPRGWILHVSGFAPANLASVAEAMEADPLLDSDAVEVLTATYEALAAQGRRRAATSD